MEKILIIQTAFIGDVILDGKSLTKQLLTNGYAREYYGKKKESWCK